MRTPLPLKEFLLSLLFPRRCVGCGRVVAMGETLCRRCEKKLPKAPEVRRFDTPAGFVVYAPFVYRGGVRRTLHAFKFQGETALAAPLGRAMATALPDALTVDFVTFVPMTPDRQWERGYNQSELLARAVARELDRPCVPLLEKIRDTATQHDLTRAERLTNPLGAYRAVPRARDRKILLIDDIVTTGSTLCECAAELTRKGVAEVLGLCAASAKLDEL